MFNIDKNEFPTNIPLIINNRRELLFDEIPILYSGTNVFGNKILGSIIDEDFVNQFSRYLHTIVEDQLYHRFIRKEISYFEILKTAKNKFFVDETFDGNFYVFPIEFNDIPEIYLPSEDSFCPDIEYSGSMNYGVSLKGKLADLHKAEIIDINEVQSNIEAILKCAFSSLEDLNLSPKAYLEPARIGSFRINFDIELESKQKTLFEIDKNLITHYINKFLDFVLTKLPNEADDVLKIFSDNLNDVKNSLEIVYKKSNAQIAPLVLEQQLLDNLNDAALQFVELSDQIKYSDSFSSLEWLNYEENEEIAIGFVDRNYSKSVNGKTIQEDKIITTSETDKTSKNYRIFIYALSTDTGKGKARLYYDDSENFHKISLHINFNKELKHSVFTNGLHEGKVINVLGIAKIINGSYKYLYVDYLDS